MIAEFKYLKGLDLFSVPPKNAVGGNFIAQGDSDSTKLWFQRTSKSSDSGEARMEKNCYMKLWKKNCILFI